MPWKKASHLFFALTIIAIGIIGVIDSGFAPIWAGVPKAFAGRQLVAGLCTVVLLTCGAGLLFKRTGAAAGLILLVYLVIWTILFKVPAIFRHPLIEGVYQSWGENAVLIAGAWAMYVWFAESTGRLSIRFLGGDTGLRIAHLLYGLALIAFGLSHFAYLNLTAPLIPAWMPEPVFWAYLTGTVYVLSGAAIATGFLASFAAEIAALQIALITILVWGPGLLSGSADADTWAETVVSWALMAAAWVVATSYKGDAWLKRLAVGASVARRPARS